MKILINISLFGFIVLAGCSERKSDTPIAQTPVSIHEAGFTDPSSANFHAKYIRSKNFDLQLCQTCHGSDYSGGTTGQSCNTCHSKPGGPENCTVCHGSVNAAPPKDLADNVSPTARAVGAHQKHLLGGIIGAPVACSECHRVPQSLTDAGHIDGTEHAEVRFDSTSQKYRSGAQYVASNVSCANTYCHGNFNGGNSANTMLWNDVSANATQCGTCHGDVTKSTLKEKAFPVSGHTAAGITSDCSTCHGSVVDQNLSFRDVTRHINGKID